MDIDKETHNALIAAGWTPPEPPTVEIGARYVPQPLLKAPKPGTRYFTPSLLSEGPMTNAHTWTGDDADLLWLRRGLCHVDHTAADLHARALVELTGKV